MILNYSLALSTMPYLRNCTLDSEKNKHNCFCFNGEYYDGKYTYGVYLACPRVKKRFFDLFSPLNVLSLRPNTFLNRLDILSLMVGSKNIFGEGVGI